MVGPEKLLVLLFIFVMQIIYRRLVVMSCTCSYHDTSLVLRSSVENMSSVLTLLVIISSQNIYLN